MIQFCIDAEQLRKALKDIEAAEANGFMYCLGVFDLTSLGAVLSDTRATYSDMSEKAHPTDGSLDWGRCQRVSHRYRFNGKGLVPLHSTKVQP